MYMSKYIFYPAASSPVLLAVSEALKQRGYGVVEQPCESVTHLILNVPSFDPSGKLKNGIDIDALLEVLPKSVTIVGGNIPSGSFPGYRVLDLLKDPVFLWENAAITARCALKLVELDWQNVPVLILGFGRIGKHLSRMLQEAGAVVTIAARKEQDLVLARTLGYGALEISKAQTALPDFKVVFNTVPTMILSTAGAPGCIPVELASKPGMVGNNIVDGRGLPGKYAPAASGELIARRFLALAKGEQV